MAETNNRLSPVVAGLTGAAIGAGVAVLTTKILSDKGFRDRIMKTASDVRGSIAHSVQMAGKQATRLRREVSGNGQSSFAHRIGVRRRTKSKR